LRASPTNDGAMIDAKKFSGAAMASAVAASTGPVKAAIPP
jgi:hypothetical protein